MNLETIIKRKTELENKLDQHLAIKQQLTNSITENVANLQAVSGAIQDCNWWIDEINGKHSKETENTPKKATATPNKNGQEKPVLETAG